ncbi:hypothetical protein WJX72_006394 [[Myrmecia] bisecta]|uniref:Cation efflux protein transmembrane domain-containing protein n=1 Tax=[Myrmecia] bisecta TaxID=41462 RepID=A0AAW1QFG5_9CHLO
MACRQAPALADSFTEISLGSGRRDSDRAGVKSLEIQVEEPEAGPSSAAVHEADDVSLVASTSNAQLVKRAVRLTWASLVVEFLTAVGGIVAAVFTDSSVVLGLALESCVDAFSSILVLWRFNESGVIITEEQRARSHHREKRASVGISAVLVLVALIVGADAIAHLARQQEPSEAFAMIFVSTVTVVAFLILGVLKWRLAKQLGSITLKKDAITSFAVTTLSVGVLISSAAYSYDERVWWFDAAVALVVALTLFVYGCRSLSHNPWWRNEFWSESPGTRPQPAAGAQDSPYSAPV